jgi:ankyrin repeat protein
MGAIYSHGGKLLDAAKEGNADRIKHLLRRNHSVEEVTMSLSAAAEGGHLHAVKILLEDPRINLGITDPLGLAARYGHIDVVNLLLTDSRVNPSARNGYAIHWAAANGHLRVVDRLMSDSRVDPSVSDNAAICFASECGHIEVVERLLSDPRINPSASNNKEVLEHLEDAIERAEDNGHSNVADLITRTILARNPQVVSLEQTCSICTRPNTTFADMHPEHSSRHKTDHHVICVECADCMLRLIPKAPCPFCRGPIEFK